MKKIIFGILLIGVLTVVGFLIPQIGADGILYIEEKDVYSYYENEIFRSNEKREFIIADYKLVNIEENNQNKTFAQINMLDDTQYGQPHKVLHPVNETNFDPNYTTINVDEELELESIEWEMYLFRDPNFESGDPFPNEIGTLLRKGDNVIYDLETELRYFSVNLEYFEFHEENGEIVQYKVNTEIASNIKDDGRVFKSSLHLIKRTMDGEIIFDYNWSIQEGSDLTNYWNKFDQPMLWVPYKLGLIALLIILYMKVSNWWISNNYKIVKVDEIEETESGNDDN